MAGNFSSKKVARAARTGGGRRRGPGSTSYGWYALLAVIILVGTGLVGFSRHERLDKNNPGSTAPLAPSSTRQGDNWYEAFGVYACDKFLPNINNNADPYGIATKNDGVIYIHPFERKYAGHNSTLGLFAKAEKLTVERDTVQMPGDPTKYQPGSKCGDKDGELVIKEWTDVKDPNSGKVIKSNPKHLLLKNNAAITVAFVPKGTTDIPMPPSAATLDQTVAADQAALQQQQQATTGDTTTTTAPADTTTTTAAPPAP